MSNTTRFATNEDIDDLRHIWKTVFADSDELINAFLDIYFSSHSTIITQMDNITAAAGYIIPVGELASRDIKIPCAMIYSMAVLPEFRGKGLGNAVVNELISSGHAAGFPAVVLCPTSDDLFSYYSSRTPLTDFFYVGEKLYTKTFGEEDDSVLEQITSIEYLKLREKALSAVPHIAFDDNSLKYQSYILSQYGGGYYMVDTSGEISCILVERQSEDTVWIKELYGENIKEQSIVNAVAKLYPASSYLIRTVAKKTGTENDLRRFGMLAFDSSTIAITESMDSLLFKLESSPIYPLYGLAFD
ncbi:MAG: GNAT family N-acetyltransferase [Oscillospiraceae bacterium]|nr:GNAT family N-acetyltransferase [Oscillospiraceae bacterium]